MAKKKSDDVRWHIVQHLGFLDERNENGYRKELCLVQWNGNPTKYDVRAWNEDYSKCSRGMTFTVEEFGKLAEAIETTLDVEE